MLVLQSSGDLLEWSSPRLVGNRNYILQANLSVPIVDPTAADHCRLTDLLGAVHFSRFTTLILGELARNTTLL